MIQLYAIDPDVVLDLERLLFLKSHFGVENGRCLAVVPKTWSKEVMSRAPLLSPVAYSRFVILLSQLKSSSLCKSCRKWDGTKSWQENLEANFSDLKTHALIALSNQRNHSAVLTFSNVADFLEGDTELENNLWRSEPTKLVESRPEAIAQCVDYFLESSDQILLVDPYFKPSGTAYPDMLNIFVKRIADSSRSSCELQVHSTHKKETLNQSDWRQAITDNALLSRVTVKVFLWHEGHLHNRYLLTDKGGVTFGEGLKPIQNSWRKKDLISRIGPAVSRERIAHYCPKTFKERLAIAPFSL